MTNHFTLTQIFRDHRDSNVELSRKVILNHLWDICVRIKKARKRSKKMREEMLEEIASKTQGVYDLGDSQVRGNVKTTKNDETMNRNYARL